MGDSCSVLQSYIQHLLGVDYLLGVAQRPSFLSLTAFQELLLSLILVEDDGDIENGV